MYWLPRRKEFKASEWRAKCKCKLPHDQHSPNPPYSSKACQGFYCDFACISCDCRWEDHETLFEFEDERRALRKKVGKEYLPLSMNKELHDLVFNTDRKALPQFNREKPPLQALQPPKAYGGLGAMAHNMGGGHAGGFGGGRQQIGYGQNDYDDEDNGDDRYLDPNMNPDYLQEKMHLGFQVSKRPANPYSEEVPQRPQPKAQTFIQNKPKPSLQYGASKQKDIPIEVKVPSGGVQTKPPSSATSKNTTSTTTSVKPQSYSKPGYGVPKPSRGY